MAGQNLTPKQQRRPAPVPTGRHQEDYRVVKDHYRAEAEAATAAAGEHRAPTGRRAGE